MKRWNNIEIKYEFLVEAAVVESFEVILHIWKSISDQLWKQRKMIEVNIKWTLSLSFLNDSMNLTSVKDKEKSKDLSDVLNWIFRADSCSTMLTLLNANVFLLET